MGAFSERPQDFLDWLRGPGGAPDADPSDFVQRRLYGLYIRDRLAEAMAGPGGQRVTLVTDEVDALRPSGDGVTLSLRSGGALEADAAILALGGLLHMVGEPERKPLRLGGHQASHAAGLTAFTGLAAALAAREAGHKAPGVRVSLAEVMQWVNWKAASGAEASGTSPGREGKNSEFQILPCKDGHVAVVYTATQWPATRALIGDARLADAKFNTRAGRRQHIAELYDALTAWFAGKTRAEIQSLAQAKGVPFGPVFSPAELLETEQYVARGFLAQVGALRMPQLPVQWNGRSFAPKPAPKLAS